MISMTACFLYLVPKSALVAQKKIMGCFHKKCVVFGKFLFIARVIAVSERANFGGRFS